MPGKSFFIDLTRCTACRGCQVACKQWHKLPAEKTRNLGSHQNPQDLSFTTYKLVRFTETTIEDTFRWLFFPDQCRHCVDPPCKAVADGYDERAVMMDPRTGGVIYTEHTSKITDITDPLELCPYNIPRRNPETGVWSKCDMCLDRVHNGMLPACVLACPTGTMSFGDRDDMMDAAKARLAKVKKEYPTAVLGDAESVRAVILFPYKPSEFYTYSVADAAPAMPFSRRSMFAGLVKPMSGV